MTTKEGLLVSTIAILMSSAAAVEAESTKYKGDCANCVDMQIVPAGSYEMGGYIDYGFGEGDGPKRKMHIKSFAMATTEVTVGEFRRFVTETGYRSEKACNIYTDTVSWHIDPTRNWENPGFPQEENHPVVCVSWDDMQAYIGWMNQKTGNSYRLPSEAEWEYVASTGGLGNNKDSFITHEEGNIGQLECCGGATNGKDIWHYTAPVKSFSADKYGLYDIRGNVWEWKQDCYQKDYVGAPDDGSARTVCDDDSKRAIRGGSYGDAGTYLSPRYRLPGPRTQGYFTAGFRMAHSLD